MCLSAFNLGSTPELTGAVFANSADRLIDESSQQPIYLVGVRIPEGELAELKGVDLLPGMPAEELIRTVERTALSEIVKPPTDGWARAFKDESCSVVLGSCFRHFPDIFSSSLIP